MTEWNGKTVNVVARLLGSFSIEVDGQLADLGRNMTANAVKMIEIIFLNREHGISKNELLNEVFSDKVLSDQNNSFNNLLYQSRKLLQNSGMDGMKFIDNHRGMIRLECAENAVTDIEIFLGICRKADAAATRAEKKELYTQALEYYRGPLLPDFETEFWVIKPGMVLKHYFDRAAQYLADLAEEDDNYEEMYRIMKHADSVYPHEKWEIGRISALAMQEKYREAYEEYTRVVQYYLETLEQPVPKVLLDIYDRFREGITREVEAAGSFQMSTARRDEEMEAQLRLNRAGGYFCQYSSFRDICNVLNRNIDKRGNAIHLMILSLVDFESNFRSMPDVLERRSECLKMSIHDVLRSTDVFTGYSSTQYVALLVGVKREDCAAFHRRISVKLHELAGSRADVQYRIVAPDELEQILTAGEKN